MLVIRKMPQTKSRLLSASERELNCFGADKSTFTCQVESGILWSECRGICTWPCMLHPVHCGLSGKDTGLGPRHFGPFSDSIWPCDLG